MTNKILVIDDNLNNLRLLQDILEDEDYLVIATQNSLEGETLAITHQPDAILLDIMMPDLDGFTLCKHLKENPLTKDILILMVTAKTESRDLKESFDYGAFDYIKKPIDEIEVVSRVKSALIYKEKSDALNRLANRDGLTQLLNHNALVKEMVSALSKKKANTFLSYLMLDIDHFKKVNDTYGHLGGDVILKEVAKILLSLTRKTDLVGRYGGEEFGILLMDANEETALEIGERIRHTIEHTLFSTNSYDIHITISCGVFTLNAGDNITASSLVQHADDALYMAKSTGRNKVVSHK